MLENRLFGLTCESCHQPFVTGSVWLEHDAAKNDLQLMLNTVVRVRRSDICPKCQAVNAVQVEALEFIAA